MTMMRFREPTAPVAKTIRRLSGDQETDSELHVPQRASRRLPVPSELTTKTKRLLRVIAPPKWPLRKAKRLPSGAHA